MKVAVESTGSYERKIQITFPAETVDQELNTAYKRIGRRSTLPGFRKGKAPRRVLEARYGDAVKGEVADKLVQQGYRDAVTTESLQTIGQPSLSDAGEVEAGSTFEFVVTVEVRPSVELTQVEGIEVVYPPKTVADDEIDAAIRRRLETKGSLAAVTDRPVQQGDIPMVELTIKDGDEVVMEAPGPMINTAGDKHFSGIEPFLVGLEIDGTKSGEVSFDENADNAMLAGRTLQVEAKVLSIQAHEVPELDDAIATEFGYDSASAMRDFYAEHMNRERAELSKNQARANLLEAMIAANPFDVPEAMVDDSLQMLLYTLQEQRRQMGMDPMNMGFNDAQMADLRARASFASKAGLILEQVGKDQDIQVTDEDVDNKINELAEQKGQPVEAIRAQVSTERKLAEFKEQLLEEKTLDWLLDRAVIVDAPTEAKPAAKKKPAKKAKPAAKDTKKAKAPDDEAPAKDAKPAAKKKAPAKKKADAKAAGGTDLSVLKGAVGKVKEAIDSGDHDAHLAELLAAEEAGKNRKGAKAAIEARIKAVG